MNNYYFTSDKWYGPVPNELDDRYFISEELIQYHNYPSGPVDPELFKWAGQVKEEGKDFGFEYTCNRRLDFCYCPKRCLDILQTAVPINKDHQKQMITEIMDADQRDGVYEEGEQTLNKDKVEELLEWMLGIGCENGVSVWVQNNQLRTSKELLTEYLKTKP